MAEIVLAGADLVLPDRVLTSGTLIVEAGHIVEVRQGAAQAARAVGAALHGHIVVPGFVDAHVHGLEGIDTLADRKPVSEMAARLPRYGVTAFSPTSVTCAPALLSRFLRHVGALRAAPAPGAARVLPAHVEGPFLHPDYAGAQASEWLREPQAALDAWTAGDRDEESGAATLQAIDGCAPDVGFMTIAPELPGGLRLIEWLESRGIRSSMGHSSATYDAALAAMAAGARRATHLFNCMPPFHHRDPGLAGAVLQSPEVSAEIIADGVHVHAAVVRFAVAAKGPLHVLAVTDGTALSGMPENSAADLGGRTIARHGGAARLADGRLAGSVMTMDRVFRMLVGPVGLSLVDAATMCATAPARALGATGGGALVRDAVADFVVLDRHLTVTETYIGGRLAYARGAGGHE